MDTGQPFAGDSMDQDWQMHNGETDEEGSSSIETSTKEMSQDEPMQIEKIDEEGDLLVKSGASGFLVFSKILTLASPVFKAMLKPGFKEGNQVRSVDNLLELLLPDDDPEALRVLFRGLHFLSKPDHFDFDMDLQFRLSQLTDKYDCAAPFVGDMVLLLRSHIRFERGVEALGKLALTAFFFNCDEEFRLLTANLVVFASIRNLENLVLPINCFKALLHRARTQMISELIEVVEGKFTTLRVNESMYDDGEKICAVCKRWKPAPTKKCHSDSSTEFYPSYCSREKRVCQFLRQLDVARIWPLSSLTETSPKDIQLRIGLLVANHSCVANEYCPLKVEIVDTVMSSGRIVDGFNGIELSSLKAEIAKPEKEV